MQLKSGGHDLQAVMQCYEKCIIQYSASERVLEFEVLTGMKDVIFWVTTSGNALKFHRCLGGMCNSSVPKTGAILCFETTRRSIPEDGTFLKTMFVTSWEFQSRALQRINTSTVEIFLHEAGSGTIMWFWIHRHLRFFLYFSFINLQKCIKSAQVIWIYLSEYSSQKQTDGPR